MLLFTEEIQSFLRYRLEWDCFTVNVENKVDTERKAETGHGHMHEADTVMGHH